MTSGMDGNVEQRRVLARLASLVDDDPEAPVTEFKRLFRRVPEETVLVRNADSIFPLDYLIVTFGALFPKEGDKSIEGAAQQPQVWPIIVECWSATDPAPLAGSVRTRLVGWSPDEDNCDEIELRGGGWFDRRDSAGRPTRYMESVAMVSSLNNSIILS